MFFKIFKKSNFKKIFAFFNLIEFSIIFFGTKVLVLHGLMISCRIVSRVNGMVINISMNPAF